MNIIFESPYPQDGFKGDDSYTGLRLVVMSQAEAKLYEPGDDEVCISISTKNWGDYFPKLSDKFVEIIRLDFDDTAVGDAGRDDVKTISSRQARDVAQFVKRHLQKKKIVIHCFAGISRSRSMAAAIADMLELPYHNFTVNNFSVYNAVRDALQAEGVSLDG